MGRKTIWKMKEHLDGKLEKITFATEMPKLYKIKVGLLKWVEKGV